MAKKIDVKINSTNQYNSSEWAVLDNCKFFLKIGNMSIIAAGVKILNNSVLASKPTASIKINN